MCSVQYLSSAGLPNNTEMVVFNLAFFVDIDMDIDINIEMMDVNKDIEPDGWMDECKER